MALKIIFRGSLAGVNTAGHRARESPPRIGFLGGGRLPLVKRLRPM